MEKFARFFVIFCFVLLGIFSFFIPIIYTFLILNEVWMKPKDGAAFFLGVLLYFIFWIVAIVFFENVPELLKPSTCTECENKEKEIK